jgi:hypothetical protein
MTPFDMTVYSTWARARRSSPSKLGEDQVGKGIFQENGNETRI